VSSAALSRDGSDDNTARIWDATSTREIAILRGHDGTVWSAALGPDGSCIVTASLDHTARIWDAVTGREIAVLRGHENSVRSAAFSPDGSRIVTASEDKTVRIWNIHLQMMTAKHHLEEACRRLAGLTILTREKMRLAGHPDDAREINVCPAL
jgi:WD40 repeat protein